MQYNYIYNNNKNKKLLGLSIFVYNVKYDKTNNKITIECLFWRFNLQKIQNEIDS